MTRREACRNVRIPSEHYTMWARPACGLNCVIYLKHVIHLPRTSNNLSCLHIAGHSQSGHQTKKRTERDHTGLRKARSRSRSYSNTFKDLEALNSAPRKTDREHPEIREREREALKLGLLSPSHLTKTQAPEPRSYSVNAYTVAKKLFKRYLLVSAIKTPQQHTDERPSIR